jgi:hypothetical protein
MSPFVALRSIGCRGGNVPRLAQDVENHAVAARREKNRYSIIVNLPNFKPEPSFVKGRKFSLEGSCPIYNV